jgi:hypothetical protein
MISVIPSLDFMRSLCGVYTASSGSAELRVWSCGYGVALDLRGEKKAEFVGVVGAYGGVVDCHALVGLPNVIRFVGDKVSESRIRFTGEGLPLLMEISREPDLIHITISLNGQEKVSHVLRSA